MVAWLTGRGKSTAPQTNNAAEKPVDVNRLS
jgi:hypothetical protein